MGLNQTRMYSEDALAVLVNRARAYSQIADEAAEEYTERSLAIARDLKRDFPKANENELAALLKQAKEKDLILDTMGRRQEFNAREAVRLYTMFQAEVTYHKLKGDALDRGTAIFPSRTPRQRS